MRLFLFVGAVLLAGVGCSQQPQWRYLGQVIPYPLVLGDTLITAYRTTYNDTAFPFFLHLHHNEATAENSLHQYLETKGGTALVLVNNRQRNLSFGAAGERFAADPNRIFTAAGIRQTLQLLSTYTAGADSALSFFAGQLGALIQDSLPLIAVHNNTDGAYSILSYGAKGALAQEAAGVYRNPEMDPDDFVFTTDPGLYEYLKTVRVSTVLQNNTAATDDGSLSVVLGKTGKVYVNIEAEHGHHSIQLRMIELVAAFVQQQYRNRGFKSREFYLPDAEQP